MDITVEVDLGALRALNAAGQAAKDGPTGPSRIPLLQPLLGVEVKRIGKHQPAVGLLDTRFRRPERLVLGLFQLRLCQSCSLQFRPGQMI